MGEFNVKLEEIKAIFDQHFHWKYELQCKSRALGGYDMKIILPHRVQQDIQSLTAILTMANYEVHGPQGIHLVHTNEISITVNSYGAIGNDVIYISWIM